MSEINKDGKISTGRAGERVAERLLIDRGYEIIVKNYVMQKSKKRYEIDIIAKKGNELVFAEVKTRTNGIWGLDHNSGIAAAAVTLQKQRHIITAATYFLTQDENSYLYSNLQPRFDVIEVYISGKVGNEKIKVNHIKNAFIT